MGPFFLTDIYCMKFLVYTLVDITETRARRGEDHLRVDQQQNFLTFLQTVGLRVNPTVNKTPEVKEVQLKDLEGVEFGSRYKGKHRVWTFEFDIEYESALNIQMLEGDFDLVPIITGLEETAKVKHGVFRTKDNQERNIVFQTLDP